MISIALLVLELAQKQNLSICPARGPGGQCQAWAGMDSSRQEADSRVTLTSGATSHFQKAA